ncbi:MAG: dihydrodipicolinate synthase family protein [Candidatus Omnitrophica bacterium]|nr:dihydrodipicolinate synthase family protein [Candidatus Omnitrophota bacterium]
MKRNFCGLIAAPFTALHPDGRVNLDPIERQMTCLKANGVAGAFVCGTTGESLSLTNEERCRVAERWQAVADKDFRVIVQVGHPCLADCQFLAAHAQKIGAAAIGCLAPNFFKPSTVEELADFCAAVASAAPDLPFYFYHLPVITGVNFPMLDFLQAARGRIPNLAGIKFTHENLLDFGQCVQFEDGRFEMLFGRDEILLAGMALGACGAVGSTYNFAAPLYIALVKAFQKGDWDRARELQFQAMQMIGLMLKYGVLVAGKAMMKFAGLDCGPVRAPLVNLNAKQTDELEKALERLGFYSYCVKVPGV